MRIAALLVVLSAFAACKDGVTPDCTTDPAVCSPVLGASVDSGSEAATTAPVDAGHDASDAAAADADAGD